MLQLAGGPHIPLRYGRTDTCTEEEVAPEGRLPGVHATVQLSMKCTCYTGLLEFNAERGNLLCSAILPLTRLKPSTQC
jgi:hypothetical protein